MCVICRCSGASFHFISKSAFIVQGCRVIWCGAASVFIHLVCPRYCLYSKIDFLPNSSFLPGWPMITWYTLERAVGQVEDRSGGGVRGERHNENGLWRVTAFGLEQDKSEHIQMEWSNVCECQLLCEAAQYRGHISAQILCQWLGAFTSASWAPRTHKAARYSVLPNRFCLICICMLRGHLIGGEVGIEKGWKAEGERHRERSRALYKERLKGGMNEQTSE